MIIRFVCIFILSFSVFGQDSKPKERTVGVAIGIDEIVKLEYKFNTKIQIGNPSVLKLLLSPAKQEITFRGLKEGKTSVTIRDISGNIRDKFIVNISSSGQSAVVQELRELVGDIEGITIGIKGGKVIVEGQIVVSSDFGRLSIVLAKYPEVLKLIELSPQTQRIIARKMQEEINKNNMKDVTVRIVNGDFWLEGVVNSEGKKKLATDIAREYLPDYVKSLSGQAGGSNFQSQEKYQLVDFVAVNEKKDPEPPSKMIKVVGQFVELSKDYNKTFGFNWSPVMTTGGSISFGQSSEGGITTEETSTLSGTIANLFPKLESAKNAGYARVIQSAMLITKEGQQASVNRARKLPYSLGTGDFQQAQTAEIKFNMSVTPSVGDKEMVKLDGLNLSINIPSGLSGSAPTTSDSTISTNLEIKSKESAAIGGIVQNSSQTSYDKNIPGTVSTGEDDQTSPLFQLGRSKAYVTEKSQFVIFITPEIIESASVGTSEIRKKFRKRQR